MTRVYRRESLASNVQTSIRNAPPLIDNASVDEQLLALANTSQGKTLALGENSYNANNRRLYFSSRSTGDIVDVKYTLMFLDPGQPNDGRSIIVEFSGHADNNPTVTDTGGAPSTRLTSDQMSGTGSSWSVVSNANNSVVVSSLGRLTTRLKVIDSSGTTDEVSL